jgi:hypothetical protein
VALLQFREAFMNPRLIVVALMIAVVPVGAQAQKPSAAKVTKTDVQKVVKLISADKAKTEAYCDIGKLNERLAEADETKDTKKLDELSQQIDALGKKTRSGIRRVDGCVPGCRSGLRRRKADRFDVRTTRQAVCKVTTGHSCNSSRSSV